MCIDGYVVTGALEAQLRLDLANGGIPVEKKYVVGVQYNRSLAVVAVRYVNNYIRRKELLFFTKEMVEIVDLQGAGAGYTFYNGHVVPVGGDSVIIRRMATKAPANNFKHLNHNVDPVERARLLALNAGKRSG